MYTSVDILVFVFELIDKLRMIIDKHVKLIDNLGAIIDKIAKLIDNPHKSLPKSRNILYIERDSV